MPPAVGATLLSFAAFAALITLATNSIPLVGPFVPFHRDEHPVAYRRFLIGIGIVGTVGALLLAYSLA